MVASAGKIVLGVSGSIAAFKAAGLASELVQAGFEVRVILTAGGARFISAMTLAALTNQPVSTDLWDETNGRASMGHLELARWADCVVVAPASAGALARLALGLTDDLLSAVALSTRAPLLLAPAMESMMYAHPATQEHLRTLGSRGAVVVGPTSGRLASGLSGPGRMAEPAVIFDAIKAMRSSSLTLRGTKVAVTAGPTYEAIDRVRFVGNRSSGKMGYAVATEAVRRGAEVVLISGPTSLDPPVGVQMVNVESAAEMRQALFDELPGMDVIIMAAAVSDFRPEVQIDDKLRRSETLQLSLVKTADIAAEAARIAPHAVHVGFALEINDLVNAAREKLARKGQDLVVGNLITSEHNPFGAETNKVVFVLPKSVEEFPALPKSEVASLLWDRVNTLLKDRRSGTA